MCDVPFCFVVRGKGVTSTTSLRLTTSSRAFCRGQIGHEHMLINVFMLRNTCTCGGSGSDMGMILHTQTPTQTHPHTHTHIHTHPIPASLATPPELGRPLPPPASDAPPPPPKPLSNPAARKRPRRRRPIGGRTPGGAGPVFVWVYGWRCGGFWGWGGGVMALDRSVRFTIPNRASTNQTIGPAEPTPIHTSHPCTYQQQGRGAVLLQDGG